MKRVLSILNPLSDSPSSPERFTTTPRRVRLRRKLKVHTRNRHMFRWVAVAFAAAAVAAPAGLAVGPDDRPDYRGMSPVLAPGSGSPDDRVFFRGSSDSLAPAALSADDRSFSRSVGEIEPASAPVEVVASPHGFDWGNAVIGGTFGVALALLGTGATLIARRRRDAPRTA
jgi:hypothetical protein